MDVYANRPQSTDELKINITQAITQIQPDLCGRDYKQIYMCNDFFSPFVEISLALFRKTDEGTEQPLADFRILALEAELIQQTYDLNVSLRLGGLSLSQDYEGEKIRIINTPMAEGKSEYLLVINLCKVDRKSPEFHSKHGSVLNSLNTNFSKVDFLVHQEAFLDAIQWGNRVQEFFASMTSKEEELKETSTRLLLPNKSTRQITTGVNVLFDDILDDSGWRQKRRRRQVKVNTIDLKLTAVMGEVSLTLKTSQRMVGAMHVEGGQLNVIIKRTYTQIDGTLNNFVFYDLREDTHHPKVTAVDVVPKEPKRLKSCVYANTKPFETHRRSFNAPRCRKVWVLITETCDGAKYLRRLLRELSAIQLLNELTRVATSATLLDHIIVNRSIKVERNSAIDASCVRAVS
ncbi:hypothetical protein J6590_012375 [Homalodisca vitripennis]|nr:hypothetical protein J6590_012375 [Homalodisca vitripennis]